MVRVAIVSLFFQLGYVLSAWAGDPDCGIKSWDQTEVFYCVGAPESGDSETLLVYFHGLGGSEREWFDEPELNEVQSKLKDQGITPWVITVSFGPGWLLTEVPSGPGLYPKLMDELLPELEQRIKPSGFGQRYLVGASMGGFNASQVMLKRPSEFDRYMFICPAIPAVGPYSSDQEVVDYIRRTQADPNRVAFMLEWGQLEFPTLLDWNQHSPLVLAQGPIVLPRVYLSCGLKDEYGFQEGAFSLYEAIRMKSQAAIWVPIEEGHHCAWDLDSIVSFLADP